MGSRMLGRATPDCGADSRVTGDHNSSQLDKETTMIRIEGKVSVETKGTQPFTSEGAPPQPNSLV
jgi:hypothetical protein